MADPIYISAAEIEAEPDGDSDDGSFDNPPPPDDPNGFASGAIPVMLESAPDSSLGSSAPAIGNLFAHQGLSYYQYIFGSASSPLGTAGYYMEFNDLNGNTVDTLDFYQDGATANVLLQADGNYSIASAAVSDGTPNVATTTTAFDGTGQLQDCTFANGDGTYSEDGWTTNADGSQTFAIHAEYANGANTTGLPGAVFDPAAIDQLVQDSWDFARDMAIDAIIESPNLAVQALGQVAKNSIGLLTVYEDTSQLVDLGTKLSQEYAAGQDMTATATEFSAKVAETALSVVAFGTGVPYTDSMVALAINLGNYAVSSAIDSYFSYKQTGSVPTSLQNLDYSNHFQLTPLQLPAPHASAASADPSATVGQMPLFEWAGLDTVGFAADPWSGVGVSDTSTRETGIYTAQPYTGPVSGLQSQFIDLSKDNLNITAGGPNMFIHSGAGEDAIDVSQFGGTNVLDGSTGSNFLVGGLAGAGSDTFFVDDRGPGADIWSTVVNFHIGDAVTIWCVDPTAYGLAWVDDQGASGYTGLTLHATSPGQPTASVTLAGYSTADLSDGRLSIQFGTDTTSGSAYMYVYGHG